MLESTEDEKERSTFYKDVFVVALVPTLIFLCALYFDASRRIMDIDPYAKVIFMSGYDKQSTLARASVQDNVLLLQ
ncbi:hypothetical protein MMIC_P1776 [Mariprofundus micogutta]|uniref:Uncharacterized protein n=1 Tax=Mariprofundus micogutta TaxID=1921010 RepID=A0A1L8CPF3_9PROT|nr:hypothetical protein [Mariprofundus micogutta]GAV20802.1 hypothetical protein MMIC_P1776 [Mariprofundus micogutta]